MTLLEKQSARKCKALKNLVDSGEYSPAYALEKLEEYFDKGKVIEKDYEPLADYLEELIDKPEEEPVEEFVEENEPIEEEIQEEPQEEPANEPFIKTNEE